MKVRWRGGRGRGGEGVRVGWRGGSESRVEGREGEGGSESRVEGREGVRVGGMEGGAVE